MGLLTDIINQKMQRHTQAEHDQRQAEMQYWQDAIKNSSNPGQTQFLQNQFMGTLSKDAQKRYKNALGMQNFLQNVVGTDEHGVLQGSPGQQPIGKGAALNSPLQQGAGGPPAVDAGGENFGPMSGAEPKTTDLGQTSAAVAPTSAPPPGFPGMLASPLGDTAHSDASPAPAPAAAPRATNAPSTRELLTANSDLASDLPSTPATPYRPSAQDNFNTFSKYGQSNTNQDFALQRNRKLADAVLGPGQEQSAAYQQILAGDKPAAIEARAQAEIRQKQIDDRVKALQTPDPTTGKSDWESMTPRQRADVRIGATQITPELAPRSIPGRVSNKDILKEDPNASYVLPDGHSTPLDPEGFSRIQVSGQGTFYQPTQGDRLTTGWGVHGEPLQYDPFVPGDAAKKGVISPSFIPTTRTGMVWKTQQNQDGTTSLVQVPETSTSVKTPPAGTPAPTPKNNLSAPSMPPPAPSPKTNNPAPAAQGNSQSGFRTVPFGGKALPEGTKEKMDAQYTAFSNTLQIMQRVKQNLPVLNNLLSAGKIELAMSPNGEAQVISRATDLTPQEAQMSADMMSLAEHINTLRGPLGATGFRGPEAFGALQAQRGSVLGNPKVTEDIINTTMQSMQGQQDAIGRSYTQHKLPLPPPPEQEKQVVKIRVRRKSDGVTGTIEEKDYDPKKYDKVNGR